MPSAKLSMLDLVAVRQGHSVRHALDLSVATAQKAEALGFARYWLAEHHNMAGIASSATAVLIGHIAGATRRIRVGAGGIMLPNHAPLVVAEAFGTLAELYPERIDLGLGRAPGTDGATMRALRRNRVESEEDFPRDVAELQRLLGPLDESAAINATPGAGTHVPIWLLGSSLFSAQLAAAKGLPYAFASHFAPRHLLQAIALYRQLYQPSAAHPKPYVVVGIPVVAAPTDEEAEYLASSTQQRVLGILTGRRGKLPPPVAHFMQHLEPAAQNAIEDFLALAAIGGPERLRQHLTQVQELTQADEFMVVTDVFDPALRLRSLEITAQAWASGTATPAVSTA